MRTFQVELIWNWEFNFVPYGPIHLDVDSAIKYAEVMENSGNGARVKKTRVIDATGKIVWAHGKLVAPVPSS